jgi:ABC-type transporter Mla subunit MlaD
MRYTGSGLVLDVFARRYEIVTLVPSALGLREGAPVTLAGQRIGQVQRIEFIPVRQKVGDNNLRVVLAITHEVQEQVRVDSRAFLRTAGLLGDRFVDISPGSPGDAGAAAWRHDRCRAYRGHGRDDRAGCGSAGHGNRASSRTCRS